MYYHKGSAVDELSQIFCCCITTKINHDKVISALELDRDVGFSRGYQPNQGHRPYDDDDENEEEDDEVEENNKEDDNNKDEMMTMVSQLRD